MRTIKSMTKYTCTGGCGSSMNRLPSQNDNLGDTIRATCFTCYAERDWEITEVGSQ